MAKERQWWWSLDPMILENLIGGIEKSGERRKWGWRSGIYTHYIDLVPIAEVDKECYQCGNRIQEPIHLFIIPRSKQ